MTDKNLSQKVLETIKNKHIKPKPRWEFLLKNSAIWTVFVLSILVGSLASSVIIFLLRHDPSATALAAHPLKDLMLKIPYFWIVILVIFLLIAFYNAKHTKRGYRYNSYLIIIISILVSFILGVGIYVTRGAEKIEDSFYKKIPAYRQITDQRGKMFIDPQAGRLAGHIIDIKDNTIQIQCCYDQVWKIVLLDDAYIDLELGMRVRLLGEQISDNQFQATDILPWFNNHHNERKNFHMRTN